MNGATLSRRPLDVALYGSALLRQRSVKMILSFVISDFCVHQCELPGCEWMYTCVTLSMCVHACVCDRERKREREREREREGGGGGLESEVVV